MRRTGGSKARVVSWTGGVVSQKLDYLATEEPLEIRASGKCIATTMRTPGHDEELAVGFLVSEGVVRQPSDIIGIAHCERGEAAQYRNILNVFLSRGVEAGTKRAQRNQVTSSSCGLCGKAAIEEMHQHFATIQSHALKIRAEIVQALSERMAKKQETFGRTGGLHAAGLFGVDGDLWIAREDIGRHNAVDKVIGHAFRKGWLPLNDGVMLVSGRASFEIMQKALSASISIVCAVSAPSSLAVQFAQDSGQTLIGFLRPGRMNIYSHPERVLF